MMMKYFKKTAARKLASGREAAANSPMGKKLKSELLRMTAIMVILIGLGIYAHEFVIEGVMAKAALNLSIFAIFGVAAGIAFRNVLSLRNEVVALQALQVDYGERAKRPKDPYARPAVVFREPELLGQGYRLIAEELGKQETIEIGAGTVQTLLHDVDQRINDRKSTLLYFSGLMVFLGLLGAFMGLMKTVHSVSELIGAMDVSGAAGADSFGKMIEGMKAPLNGMSVGFSSSLFGLMTSMVLGALERCMTSAMKTLRNEFEHWLSNLAALEANQSDAVGQPTRDYASVRKALDAGAGEMAELRSAIVGLARGAESNRAEIAGLTGAVTALAGVVGELADPRPLLSPMTEAVADLAHSQSDMLAQVHGLYEDAEADRAHIRATLAALSALIERSAALDGDEIHRQLDTLISLTSEPPYRLEAEPRALAVPVPTSALGRLVARFAGWLGLSPLRAARRSLHEARALRFEVREGLAANRRATRELAAKLDRRLQRMAVAGARGRDAMARLDARAKAQQAAIQSLASAFAPSDAGTDGAAGKDTATLSGDARSQMERLRRRLGTRFEEPAPPNLSQNNPAAAPDAHLPTSQRGAI